MFLIQNARFPLLAPLLLHLKQLLNDAFHITILLQINGMYSSRYLTISDHVLGTYTTHPWDLVFTNQIDCLVILRIIALMVILVPSNALQASCIIQGEKWYTRV